jgi:hypothetical protein
VEADHLDGGDGERRGQPSLALAVYKVTLDEGFHDRYSRERYEQLKEQLEEEKRTKGSLWRSNGN